jgi:hypothetical protein
MRRLAIVVLCLGIGVTACGRDEAEDAGQAMEDAATAASEAARSAAEQASEAADEAAEQAAEAADAAMEQAGEAADAAAEAAAEAGEAAADAVTGGDGCLELVAAGEFADAVSVCTQELAADPANQALKEALDKAKAGAGQ